VEREGAESGLSFIQWSSKDEESWGGKKKTLTRAMKRKAAAEKRLETWEKGISNAGGKTEPQRGESKHEERYR